MSFRGAPSFVKMLIEDNFTEEIRIPPAFMDEHEEDFTRTWMLETPELRKALPVEVVQHGPHHYLSGPVWQRFAELQQLSAGDILLFRYVGESEYYRHSVFYVELYEASGLQKRTLIQSPTDFSKPESSFPRGFSNKYVPRPKEKAHKFKRSKTMVSQVKVEADSGGEYEGMTDRGNKSRRDGVLEFELTLRKSYFKSIYFPAKFIMQARLHRKNCIFLSNTNSERKWEVNLRKITNRRVMTGRGWQEFRNDNNLIEGETYKFTLFQNKEANTLFVHPVERVMSESDSGSV